MTILWTASAPGSDNTRGLAPFIAPMKITFLKSLVFRSRARCGFALLASVISIWFALTPGAAQSKNQKRIFSLQIGEASEGARVTVVSDSALNDYEAFRRGDRFYVRIPSADFVAGKPGFRGDGFEDVQVQKVGDSVVVSFKLQPGATARVDQRANHLDVIFSSPNRMARSNRTNTGTNRGTYIPTDGIVRVNNPQTLQHRQRDAAGPMPPGTPGSPQATRERVVAGRVSDFQAPRSQSAQTNPRADSYRRGNTRAGTVGAAKSGTSSRITTYEPSSTNSKYGTSSSTSRSEPRSEPSSSNSKYGASSSTARSEPSSSNSKYGVLSNTAKSESSPTVFKNEPSPAATRSTSTGYPALATSTPAPGASQPAGKSPGLTGSQNWKSRSDIALQWVKANRTATLVGALVLFCILVFLVVLLFRRRKQVVKAKQRETTLAQPKHSADIVPNGPAAAMPVNSSASNLTSTATVNENTAPQRSTELNPAVRVAPANARRTSGIQENAERGKLVPEQAKARSAAVAAPPNHAWVPASSQPGSSTDEDQEREVFEL
jgi:hypothetical protein